MAINCDHFLHGDWRRVVVSVAQMPEIRHSIHTTLLSLFFAENCCIKLLAYLLKQTNNNDLLEKDGGTKNISIYKD